MPHTRAPSAPDRLFAALAGLGYLLAGLVWIGFSDQAGGMLFSSSEALTRFQTYKGAGFVLVSAVVVFALAARASRQPLLHANGRSRAGVRAMLMGLVMVTAVPLATVLGYNVWRQTGSSVDEARTLVQGHAQSTSARALAYLEDRQRLAQRLAQRTPAGGSQEGACDSMLVDVAGLLDDVVDVLVLDAAGGTVCAARGGIGVPVTAAQLDGGAGMLLTPAPATSPVRPVVALTYPFRAADGGSVAGSVQLQLAVPRLERVAAGSAASGVVIALLTSEGLMLARAPKDGVPTGDTTAELT
ncbi:MAG: hypothetical protein EOO24_16185, partial [Comamonadaceae bacterium]